MTITTKTIEPRSWGIAAGDRKTRPAAYAVLVDGERIGRVDKRSTASRRKVGRLLGSLHGYPQHWEATLDKTRRPVGYRHPTRKRAVDELVEAWRAG